VLVADDGVEESLPQLVDESSRYDGIALRSQGLPEMALGRAAISQADTKHPLEMRLDETACLTYGEVDSMKQMAG
jgi:hypothetical protein